MTPLPFYEQAVRIAAPPEVVFELIVDPQQMLRWIGVHNEMDARPGGQLRIDVTGRDIAVGEFVVIDRPRRVVFTWGWEGSAAMPPGTSTVEITLATEKDGTLLTLTHRDCPPAELDAHAAGWTHFLERLTIAATGDTGPDPWLTALPEELP